MKISRKLTFKLSVLCTGLAAAITAPIWATTEHIVQDGSDYGCVTMTVAQQNDICSRYWPYYSITPRAKWDCTYDADGNLTGADNYVCGWYPNASCCYTLDNQHPCPNLSCRSRR